MFVRAFNVVLFLLAAAAIVVNYGIADKARAATVALNGTDQSIRNETATIHDLNAKFTQLSLAELPVEVQPTVQLASLSALPRREDAAPSVHEISAPVGEGGVVQVSAGN